MATQVLTLIVNTQGASQAQSQLKSIGTSVSGIKDTLGFMRNALVALSFIRAAEGAIEMVNQYQLAQNQIKLVTNNLREAQIAQKALADLAVATRAPYEETVYTFAQLARTTTSMNMNYGQLLTLTKMWNESLAISGANMQSAKNSFRDFIEMMAVGVVQGRQLRAMIMQNPVFAQSIASGLTEMAKTHKELGSLAGDLQKLLDKGKELSGSQVMAFATAHRGAFTTKIAVEALLTQTLAMDTLFSKTDETISQAFQNLYTKTMMFVGGVVQATGAGKDLNYAIEKLGDNIGPVLTLTAAIAGMLALNIVTNAFLNLGNIGLNVLKTLFGWAVELTGAFVRLAGAIIMGTLPLSTTAFLIAGIGVAIFGALGGFAALNDAVKNNGGYVEVAIGGLARFIAIFQTLINHGSDLWGVFAEHAYDAVNSVVDRVHSLNDALQNFFTSAFFYGSGINAEPYMSHHEAGANPYRGASDKAGAGFADDVRKNIAEIEKLKDQFKNLLKGGVVDGDEYQKFLGLKPANAGKTGDLDEGLGDKVKRAIASIADAIAKFGGPMASYNKDVEDFSARLAKSREVLSDVEIASVMAASGFDDFNSKTSTSAKLQEAWARSALGLTDSTKEWAQWQTFLNDKLADGTIKTLSYEDAVTRLNKEIQTKQKTDPSIEAGLDIAMLEQKIEKLNQASIATSIYKTYVGDELSAINKLNVGQDVLNTLYERGVITLDKYKQGMRDLAQETLKYKTDALSGVQDGVLEMQKKFADTAAYAKQAVISAFDDMSDALTKFVTTGKFSLSKFMDDAENNVAKALVDQSIMKPLGDMVGGWLGLGSLNKADGSQSNPFFVKMADGAGGVSGLSGLFGGSAGGGGSIFDIFGSGGSGGGLSSLLNSLDLNVGGAGLGGSGGDLMGDLMTAGMALFGFASGGSFDVGGSGGTDSQPVMFKATPGEHVSVGQDGGSGTVVQIIDQRSGGGTVQTSQSSSPDGKTIVRAIIRDEVKSGILNGHYDREMNATYGIDRKGLAR